MAINLYCPQCRQSCKLNTIKCKCGNNLKKIRQYKVRVKLPTGQWKSKTVPSLESARKVEAKFKTQAVEQGVFQVHKAPVIDIVWSKYLAWAKLNKRSWNDDEARWLLHVEPHLKGIRLDRLTPQMVQTVVNDISTKERSPGKQYAPATVKQVLVLMKRVINWGRKQGLYQVAVDPKD